MSEEEPAQLSVSTVSTVTDEQSEKVEGMDVVDVIPCLEHNYGDGTLHEDQKDAIEDDWDNNPSNALNWSFRRKWTTVSIVSLYTFVSPLASSMMAPGLPGVATKYAITNQTYLAMTLSIYLLSFALGPLVLAPLSEMYGRTWILHIGNIFSVVFNLGCAFAPNAAVLVTFRFLAGLSGSAPIACGPGSVSDCFAARDRASAMAVYSLGPLVGPVIGPIAGGFIAEAAGIRFVFITIAGIGAVSSFLGLPFLRETYAPVIRRQLARRLNDEEKLTELSSPAGESKLQYIWTNISRPPIIFVRSLICSILSIYMAFLYGIYYVMFSIFGNFFTTTYGLKTGVGGLAYLGLGIGFFAATIFGAKWADRIYKYLADRNGGVGKPEMRMPALFFGSFFIPIGLFWFGWSAQAKTHWIMPIMGSCIFGFGMMTCFLPVTLYLVDAFHFAASAVAAASVVRCVMGFAFPLFGQQMFDTLGYGGGNSLLAGLAIVLGIPFPVWIYYKGESLRLNSKIKL